MAQLYAYENFDYPVVEFLRRLGHDVITVQEAGRADGDDPQVLADAAADGRAVLTFNRKDFRRLHRNSTAHAGIVACKWDSDRAALAARIDQAIVAAGLLAGQFLRVNRPP
jgi:hypothetical protein